MQTAAIRKTAVTALVFANLLLSEAGAQGVTVLGARSCGTWIADRATTNGWPAIANQGWLIGYLSGRAAASGKDFIKGTDASSIFLWVDNYCRANPLMDLEDAGSALSRELIKLKGL